MCATFSVLPKDISGNVPMSGIDRCVPINPYNEIERGHTTSERPAQYAEQFNAGHGGSWQGNKCIQALPSMALRLEYKIS